ncbi:MAG: twin-arginine translocase TatA/TatE family subunit [Oligoflexia bacterium]|nr:twin-arginine translocase TatA/TatE family subunit [Oligoflexia bacterium]
MGQFSFWHLLIVLVIVLIFFGPNRLPGLGQSLGKAIKGFKEGLKGIDDEKDKNDD